MASILPTASCRLPLPWPAATVGCRLPLCQLPVDCLPVACYLWLPLPAAGCLLVACHLRRLLLYFCQSLWGEGIAACAAANPPHPNSVSLSTHKNGFPKRSIVARLGLHIRGLASAGRPRRLSVEPVGRPILRTRRRTTPLNLSWCVLVIQSVGRLAMSGRSAIIFRSCFRSIPVTIL